MAIIRIILNLHKQPIKLLLRKMILQKLQLLNKHNLLFIKFVRLLSNAKKIMIGLTISFLTMAIKR